MIHFILWGVTFIIWPGEILGLGMIWMMWHFFRAAQRDPSNPIDFGSMFVWPAPGEQKVGQTSAIIFIAFCGAMTGIWVVVDQEFKSKLDSTIFLGFMGLVIFGKAGTEFFNMLRDRGPPLPSPPPPPNQIIGNAGNVNAAPAVPVPVLTPDAPTVVVDRPRKTPRKKGKR